MTSTSVPETTEVNAPVIAGRHRTPGDLLLHPAALAALAVVIVNDRVLKVRFPSELSGKLSDFAGLVYFPLFLVAGIEAVRWLYRRGRWPLTPRAVIVATVIVGVAMVLIKTWFPAAEVYRTAIGGAMWPFAVPSSLLEGTGLPPLQRVDLVADRVDLFALVMLAIPVWVARRIMDDARPDRGGQDRPAVTASDGPSAVQPRRRG